MQRNAFILLATALFCSSVFSVLADNPARYVVASPDHPGTWEVGANDKLSQELHWDSAKRLLLLNVVYAYVPYSERWDPTEQEAYTVRFPNVLCDERTRTLYVPTRSEGKIVLGSLREGFTGPKVKLRDNVEIVAHRLDKRIDAKLVIH